MMFSSPVASTYLLSERRLRHFSCELYACNHHVPYPAFMTMTHFSRVILKQTTQGCCTIPASAWDDLAQGLRRKFGAALVVHDRSYDESDRESLPHYEVAVILPGSVGVRGLVPIFLFIDPRISRIIKKYTTHAVPLAR